MLGKAQVVSAQNEKNKMEDLLKFQEIRTIGK